MESKKTRDCNFELLRIISMLMIIMHHYVIHSDFVNIPVSLNKLVAIMFSIGGKVGVNLFIMISGYYILDSKIKIKKVLKIVFEVCFYSILILILVCAFGKEEVNVKMIIKSFLPITYALYWFVTPYIWVYILTPYITKFVKNLEQKEYGKLLIIMNVCLTIIPTIMIGSNTIMSNFIWFVYLYLLVTYIRLFDIKYIKANRICIVIIYFMLFVLFGTLMVGIKDTEIVDKLIEHFTDMNSIFCLILSLMIFLYFKNINIQENKIILFLSNKSFAVYLLHDNPLLRNFLWINLLKADQKYNINTIALILDIILTSILIYGFGTLIEYVRTNLLEKKIMNSKYINIIERKFSCF